MRLQARLAHLRSPAAPASALSPDVNEDTERSARIARLRTLIGEVVTRDKARAPTTHHGAAPGVLPVGACHDTATGPLHVVERWLEPSHAHGRVRVQDALRAQVSVLARLALDPALEGVDLANMLILDTETTGLSGGTGTVPFLIGLGYFEDGALKLEQLFLNNLGGEAPLLQRLSERLARASCLVTYNGKAFDWPLLRTRFILNRIALPEPPPHLDLLHCARRVLRPRLTSVRLTEVERSVLGFYRDDDIDGAEIPGLYLGYLRGEDPRALLPVLEHNAHDIIALAAILWHLCAHFAVVQPDDDPRDHLAYARLALRARDFVRAHEFAEAAALASDAGEVAHPAWLIAASVARQCGDLQAAVTATERALAAASSELLAARAHLALSRLYERRLKDLRRAHHHAQHTLEAEGADAHGRRLSRLLRRMQRLAIS
jgi:uncharacterized protein YprB with RNaseH-like and TPR domain